MTITQILSQFAHDGKVATVLVLIFADIVLGVVASLTNPARAGTFSFAYLANFLRNDVLGKIVPWLLFYAADVASRGAGIVLGVDFGTLASAAWVVVLASLVGSLTSSLADLGLPVPLALQRRRAA